jgi:hypothetical protein
MHILNEPMVVLYTLLPFILVKDFGAGPLELSLFISLRPIFTFFSYFWGINLSRKKTGLLSNVITAYVFAYLPFLLLSWTGNTWLLLLSAAFYQLFYRAGLPGWMEVLQQKLPTKTRESMFSVSFVLGFVVGGVIGVFLGVLLDANPGHLRGLLSLFSLIGLMNLFFLKKIPTTQTEPLPQKERFLTALKTSLHLMRESPGFWVFQAAFMVGGGALMLMSPSLSLFYVDVLSLSHAQITIARFVCMAFGVLAASFFWQKGLQRFHVNVLSAWVLAGFGLFALAVLLAEQHLLALFFAFFLYGVAQSGSHLVWNLSGPIFAKGNGSVPYTSVNLLMVGIRGLFFPLLGGALAAAFEPRAVISVGLILCFIGALVLHRAYGITQTLSIPPKSRFLS